MIKKVLIYLSTATFLTAAMPENYYKIKDTKAMKKEFFNILTPLVVKENNNILNDRIKIKNIFKKLKDNNNSLISLPKEMLNSLVIIAKKYKIKDKMDKKSLLIRVDKIPTALVLAQASIESGWGKSRFIRIANNIFGHWTYSKSGILPKNRTKGKTHRIRVFKTLQGSVAAYMRNLNTHRAYLKFRAKRVELLNSGKTMDGNAGAEKMDKYSAIGQKYVKMLKTIIRQNKLESYASKFFENNVSHETFEQK